MSTKTISIHAPRMGSDFCGLRWGEAAALFQSTLPGWGATAEYYGLLRCLRYFNPRSPDGERRRFEPSAPPPTAYFNPRSPDGERPDIGAYTWTMIYFNPRSPDGERHINNQRADLAQLFQSTLPGWGATRLISDEVAQANEFQSTLPGWGATVLTQNPDPSVHNFNPRSPDGERLNAIMHGELSSEFQSTLPGWGATQGVARTAIGCPYFNPRSPDGERPASQRRLLPDLQHFNPRSPDGERLRTKIMR